MFYLYERLGDSFEGIRQKFKEFIVEKGKEIINIKINQLKELEQSDKNKFFNDSNVNNLKCIMVKSHYFLGPLVHN